MVVFVYLCYRIRVDYINASTPNAQSLHALYYWGYGYLIAGTAPSYTQLILYPYPYDDDGVYDGVDGVAEVGPMYINMLLSTSAYALSANTVAPT